MSEKDERLLLPGPRGPQGNQGNRGERGAPGLSIPVRRALVFLFVLNVLLAGASMLWTAHAVQVNNQARCASIEADASIPVPRPVAGNPSREWEAKYEAIERQRERLDGCH